MKSIINEIFNHIANQEQHINRNIVSSVHFMCRIDIDSITTTEIQTQSLRGKVYNALKDKRN